MGLFDFITKTASNNSNPQTNPPNAGYAQTTTNSTAQSDGRLVQAPFSDVVYPLPVETQEVPPEQPVQQNTPPDIYATQDNTQYYGQPQINQPAETTYTQTYNPDQTPVTNMQFPVPPENQFDQSQQYVAPPQDQPVINNQVAEIPVESQTAEVPQQQESDNSNNETEFLEYQPQFSATNVQNEVVPANNVTQPEALPALPELVNQNPIQEESVKLEIDNNLETIPETQEVAVEDVSAENLVIGTQKEDAPVVQDLQTPPESNLTEIENKPLTPESEVTNVAPNELPVVETNNVELEIPATKLPEVQLPPVISDSNAIDETPSVEPNLESDLASKNPEPSEEVVVGSPKNEVSLDKEIFEDIETAVKEEFEKDQVVPSVAPQSGVNSVEQEVSQLKVFKSIGIVGLNVETPNQAVSEKLMELVRLLSVNKLNFVLDSGKGYGENLLNKLLEHKNNNIMGAYLKPFYSDYSDEPKAKVNTSNYSTAIFSSLDLKLKYLIKSSDIFIIPETSGIANISLLFALLSNSYLYFGQHKPIILLGTGWDETVKNFISTFHLNEIESKLFNICQTPSEIVTLITKLDSEYSDKTKVNVNKVIDMRNESDESEYFVNNF